MIKPTKKLPKHIKVTFTKGDVAKAGIYDNGKTCIMATALKRLGFKRISVGGWGSAEIQDVRYDCSPELHISEIEPMILPTKKPFYLPKAVGMKFTLTRLI